MKIGDVVIISTPVAAKGGTEVTNIERAALVGLVRNLAKGQEPHLGLIALNTELCFAKFGTGDPLVCVAKFDDVPHRDVDNTRYYWRYYWRRPEEEPADVLAQKTKAQIGAWAAEQKATKPTCGASHSPDPNTTLVCAEDKNHTTPHKTAEGIEFTPDAENPNKQPV